MIDTVNKNFETIIEIVVLHPLVVLQLMPINNNVSEKMFLQNVAHF